VQNNQATDFPVSFNSSAENICNVTYIAILYSEENQENRVVLPAPLLVVKRPENEVDR